MTKYSEHEVDMAEGEQYVIETIIKDMLETLAVVKRRHINVSDDAYNNAFISIEQTLQDLFYEEYESLGRITGKIDLPVSQIQAQWLKEQQKLRVVTNPATYSVLDAIATQNKAAAESEV